MIKSIYHTKSDFPKGLKNSEVILVYKKEDHTCQRFSNIWKFSKYMENKLNKIHN